MLLTEILKTRINVEITCSRIGRLNVIEFFLNWYSQYVPNNSWYYRYAQRKIRKKKKLIWRAYIAWFEHYRHVLNKTKVCYWQKDRQTNGRRVVRKSSILNGQLSWFFFAEILKETNKKKKDSSTMVLEQLNI